jgi:hypothetical protein
MPPGWKVKWGSGRAPVDLDHQQKKWAVQRVFVVRQTAARQIHNAIEP